MNVLSLFDGISCGKIALERAGFNNIIYFASEIDKHAIKISKHNYSDILHIGDVKSVKAENLPKIDLLIGGSPCQGFSFAGKNMNFEDPRSKLFFEYYRILCECKNLNPHIKFLLENVKMKKESEKVITNLLGVEPIKINSSLLSAQNRERLYWTNIEGVEQPVDRGVLLKDIIGNGSIDREKSYCIASSVGRTTLREYFLKKQGGLVKECLQKYDGNSQSEKRFLTNTKAFNEKGNTITACFGKGMGTNGCTNVVLNGVWRMLTPLECERLQTLPDNYTACVSNTQRYKTIGNGWTVDIIAHILKNLPRKEA